MPFCGSLGGYYLSEAPARCRSPCERRWCRCNHSHHVTAVCPEGLLAVLFLFDCELDFGEHSVEECPHWLHQFSLHYGECVVNIARPALWLDTLHCFSLQALENEFSDHSGYWCSHRGAFDLAVCHAIEGEIIFI